MANNEFDAKNFDWVKAIWEIRERLAKVEENLANHLKSHQIWTKIMCGILSGVIVGLTILVVSRIFTR